MKPRRAYRTRTSLRHVVTIVLMLGAMTAHASEDDPLLYADADTSAAHQASMAFFENKATAARKNAEEHRELRARYLDRGLTIVARHCLAIATRYDEIAESYDVITAGHGDLSEDGRSAVSDLHNGHTPTKPSP